MKRKLSVFLICLCVLLGGKLPLLAQVSVGIGEKPVEGAILQLKTIGDATSNGSVNATQGFGFPRVELSDNQNLYPMFLADPTNSSSGPNSNYAANKSSIDKSHTGLVVYNVGSLFSPGLYFWNGSEWRVFYDATAEPAMAVLNCNGAAMTPGQQVMGGTAIIAGTILQIPYTGSNGGSFNGVTLNSVGNTNVKASIAGGMLSVGNGVLNFSLSGMPTVDQQAPNGIKFDLTPFLAANPGITGCNEVVVGEILEATIETSAVMGYMMKAVDEDGIENYYVKADSPDGKFSIRVRVPGSVDNIAIDNQNINLQIRTNQSTAQTIIWNYMSNWSGGQVEGAKMSTVPSKRWGGMEGSATAWTDSGTGNTGYWGQRGIYDGSGPEYRRYSWIPLGPENNVAYEIHMMCALDTPTPTTNISTTKLKVYIKFTQVTAAN